MEPQEFYIGQKFYQPYPPEAATWCDNNNAMIEEKHEEQETERGKYDVRYYEIVERPKPLPPTHDEISQLREQAYEDEVDGITAHIQRLRDIDPAPQEEIDELIAERDAKVEEIKQRYPYPTDPITEQ